MTLSQIASRVDGTQTDFTIPFDYIAAAHVKCKVNGVLTTFTWLTPGTVRISPAPVEGAYVLFYRETSPNVRLVDYATPGTLSEEDLDADSKQAFFLCQEAVDTANQGIVPDPADGKYDFHGRYIKNVPPPVVDSDVVTMGFISPYVGTALSAAAAASGSASAAATSATNASNYASAAAASQAAAAASAATLDTVDVQIHGATAKTSPADADEFGFADSAASWVIKKFSWANLKAAFLATINTWTKAQRGSVTPLTDAATVAVDFSLSNNFSLLTTSGVGATRKLGNPTNIGVGQSGIIAVTTDAVSRALTFDTYFKFAGGQVPILSVTSGAVDYYSYYVSSPTTILISQAKDVK